MQVKSKSANAAISISSAAIYVRVSTPDQASSERTSLAWQESVCRAEAERLGLSVVHVYSEQFTGAILARPELQRALEGMEAGTFSTLIIADLSRYSRERGGQEQIISRIHQAGGRLISCDVGAIDPTNPESELQRWIRGDIDAYERLRTGARTKRGSLEQAKSGRQPCRRFSPLGYHIVTSADEIRGFVLIDGERHVVRPGDAGTYRIVPSEAQVVRTIFELYLSGLTLNETVAELERRQVPTKSGGHWKRGSVQVILHSRNYIGEATYGRRISHRNSEGKRIHRSRAAEDVVTIAIPAIVSPESWESAQARCAANTRKSGNPNLRWLLSGLCRCGTCGARVVAQNKKTTTGTKTTPETTRTQYYNCWPSGQRSEPLQRAPSHAFNRQGAESLVLSAITATATKPELLAAAIEWAQRRARQDETRQAGARALESVHQELIGLRKRQRAIVEAQIAGMAAGVDSGVYQEQLEAVSAQIAEATRKERVLLAQSQPIPTVNPAYVAQLMSSALRSAQELLRAADPAVASRLLAGIIEEVMLYRGDTPAVERVIVKFAPLSIEGEPIVSSVSEESEMSNINQGSGLATVQRTWAQQTVATPAATVATRPSSIQFTVAAGADGSIAFESEVVSR